jgi:TRAP-type C4-dicarboxylate transport system substrate-binding protein
MLKINIYPSGALAKTGTMYDAVKAGTVDIALDPGPYYIGRFPMSEATQLPFLGAQSSWAASRAWMDLYYTFPELRKEYADVRLLWLFSQGPAQLITRKPVRKLEEMKGLIVRAPGGMGDYIKVLGGSPVSIPAPECYLALSKGTIDATVFPGEAIPTWKLHEATKYVSMCNIAVQWFWVAMNRDKYTSLPKDLQKVIDECSGTVGADIVGKGWNEADKAGFELGKQKGMELIYLSPEEGKRWEQQVATVTDKWVKTMEAKGYPAKKFVDEAKKSIEKYNKQLAGQPN